MLPSGIRSISCPSAHILHHLIVHLLRLRIRVVDGAFSIDGKSQIFVPMSNNANMTGVMNSKSL
jgi:hypothetical protein